MTDVWRRKRYYGPRVLVSISDVLESSFDDHIVCLTGGMVNLLRNLLAYAHRRSTWVDTYHTGYYLAPDTEDWDDIEGVVADLEDRLMGCTEWEALLEQIASCVCTNATNDWPAGGQLEDQRDYDDYQSSVEYDVGDPPEGFEDWDEWTQYKCCAAQAIVDDINTLGAKLEVLYSTGAVVTFTLFQTLVLGSAVAPPVALVMAILGTLAAAGTAIAMIAFQAWVSEHKQNLVCAIHQSDNESDAYDAVQAYIDAEWDLVLGIPFGKHLFNHDVISKCFDGGVDVSAYSAQYCESCSIVQGDGWYAVPLDPETYTFVVPPGWFCPGQTGGTTGIDLVEDHELIGLIWSKAGVAGDHVLNRTCGVGDSFWADGHPNLASGSSRISGKAGTIDWEEVQTALMPAAGISTTNVSGSEWNIDGRQGTWCWENLHASESFTMTMHYAIFEGAPPE